MSEVRHWIVNYFPIKNAAGRVKQVGAVVVDISKQRKLEDALSSLGGKLQEERDRLQAFLEGSNTLVRSELDFPHLFPNISADIRRVMRHEFACLALLDKAAGCVRVTLQNRRCGMISSARASSSLSSTPSPPQSWLRDKPKTSG